jgi:hypothetical protein
MFALRFEKGKTEDCMKDHVYEGLTIHRRIKRTAALVSFLEVPKKATMGSLPSAID